MINHDERREAEVQLLVKKILRKGPVYFYNPNGVDEYTCPYCYSQETRNNKDPEVLEDIIHATDCAYLIAKGLEA